VPRSLPQCLRKFFCHKFTSFNATNSEMLRVNMNFLLYKRMKCFPKKLSVHCIYLTVPYPLQSNEIVRDK